jgi:aminoglycoside phosphotransferase (APT) family kinase protein
MPASPDELDPQAMRQRLQPWLAEKLPGARNLVVDPLRLAMEAGNSAETFFFDVSYDRGGEGVRESLVMRRQRAGADLFLDADLALPWRMMQAMGAHSNIPVPACFGVEFDCSILAAPFLVMRKLPGRIPPHRPNYNLGGWVVGLSPKARGALWRNGIETIASINRLDWRKGFTFLDDRARGDPGLDQYLNWIEAWYRWAIRGRGFPLGDAALDQLLGNRPSNPGVEVLWGDPSPHNMLFQDDLCVSGVLDWEMAALGPGEADLAWWIFFDELVSEEIDVPRLAGLPGRAESIAIYETAVGRKAEDMDYYGLLAEFRMSVTGIRLADRKAGGEGKANTESILQRPVMRMMARRLGLREPEQGPEYKVIRDRMAQSSV